MSTNPLLTHRVLHAQAKGVRKDLGSIDAAVKGAASLAPGAHGDAVIALQHELSHLGLYSGQATGHYDAATEAAVKKLQAAQGQAQTGIVDDADAGVLRKHEKFVKDGFADSPGRLGQSGRDIRSMEAKLKGLGFDPGKIDGVFDKKTLEAVRAFRRDAKGISKGDSITHKTLGGASQRIKQTEKNLKTLGYEKIGKPNGNYGKETARAVRSFQRKHHLEVTGEANFKTRKALAKATKGSMYPHVSPKHFQNGYDVSAYQTTAQVKSLLAKKSTRFLGMKATEGTTYTNPNFKKWWKMAGKKLQPGKFDARIAYHFMSPSSSGRAQADKFLRTVGVHGKLKPGTRLALDWEGADLASTTHLRDAAKRIHQVTGTWPLIYTSASQVGRARAAVPHAPIWDAHYPAGKSDYKYPFVQTSGSGVDHDLFTGDELALRRWAGW